MRGASVEIGDRLVTGPRMIETTMGVKIKKGLGRPRIFAIFLVCTNI